MGTLDNAVEYKPAAFDFDNAVLSTRTAGAGEIDELGHVNNAVYLAWAQEAAISHWVGAVHSDIIANYIWVVLRHEIDYRDPVLLGDMVEVRTWLGGMKGPRWDRYVDIRKPGAAAPAAKVLTTWCLLDAKTRRPRRIGPKIVNAFSAETA